MKYGIFIKKRERDLSPAPVLYCNGTSHRCQPKVTLLSFPVLPAPRLLLVGLVLHARSLLPHLMPALMTPLTALHPGSGRLPYAILAHLPAGSAGSLLQLLP